MEDEIETLGPCKRAYKGLHWDIIAPIRENQVEQMETDRGKELEGWALGLY